MNYTIWIYSETIHFTHHYFDNLSAPDLHWRNWQCKEQRVQHTQSEWKSGLWTLRYTVLQDCRYILLPFSSSNCFTQSVYTVRGLDALNIKHAGKSRAELFPFLYDVRSFKFQSVASRLFRTSWSGSFKIFRIWSIKHVLHIQRLRNFLHECSRVSLTQISNYF